ncbi:16S rRNA (uracil(1498)-N(3))-methyltransferase [Geobacter sp. DSM 9736]|uniref:16S rRNA (uracil(1498)-N(3))-methyltransferase n=1 Tax=Geobacter sp. DSM 9736 TaxID=1277350 RepID=UPI000B50BAEC|nr:16S rRNA (uracil(1498)-N(3))-methyltransferase [Geobacter sp. DSM 9736]SNB47575.1 16S rRNA (uracil1498-N3)-methyltransferase [Geobacter sp. DSM 9736]
MRRFFVPAEYLTGSEVIIGGETFHHMAKVLRLKKNTEVLLFDGEGNVRGAVLRDIHADSLVLDLLKHAPSAGPSPAPAITLYQGLPKGDKIDHILQKATEIGAAAIIPFQAERSVRRIDQGRESGILARWQRIVRESSRQCGRNDVPEVAFSLGLGEAIKADRSSVKLLLWEEQGLAGLKDVLDTVTLPTTISIIIGPEGGIAPKEAAIAREHGFVPVSMGKRIVRTETAGIVILSILQFVWGDIG